MTAFAWVQPEGITMPEVIQTLVYRFDELCEAGKEAARAWYRERGVDEDWHECVLEDFERVCVILGIALRTRTVSLMGGGVRSRPCIGFTGFWNQGDGACFEGRYRYANAASRRIRAHAPTDAGLHRIADALQAVQRRNLYQLCARITHRGRGCHEYSMAIAVERDSPTGQDMTPDAGDAIAQALRDLARWLYRQLEQEYASLISDEAVDEAIAANGYTFTQAGRRFG
jgi:hypothetical protein